MTGTDDFAAGGQAPRTVRLVLAGEEGGALGRAADMARASGAQVSHCTTVESALAHIRARGGDLAMVDVRLDIARFIATLRAERIALPVLACGIAAPAEQAVAAIRAGACDYVPLPPDRDLIAAALLSVTRQTQTLLGEAPAFRRAADYARAMARSAAPIWLHGEAGTGKERLARVIHHLSGRTGPFVTVECAQTEPDWLASELFGHRAGAFPGAGAMRTGRLAEAAGGTCLVRAVDALPPGLQTALAETLAARRIRPLAAPDTPGHPGPTGAEPDDDAPLTARLIVTSRADLRALAFQGRFRPELMHRLGLVQIGLPPLRDRGADIALLARHFADRIARDNGLPPPALAAATLTRLNAYGWPGNVAELEQVMHRAVLLAPGPEVPPAALVRADGVPLGEGTPAAADAAPMEALVGQSVAEVERDLILRTLRHCDGNRTTASAILGISVRTMRNKLREFAEAGFSIAPSH